MTSNTRNQLPYNRAPLTAPDIAEAPAHLRLTRRGKLARTGGALLLTGAGLATAFANRDPGYSNDQMSHMRQEHVTVTTVTVDGGSPSDDNPSDILHNHERAVFGDGGNAASLESFLQSQGKAKDASGNPALENGQDVLVPVPDGVDFVANPKQ